VHDSSKPDGNEPIVNNRPRQLSRKFRGWFRGRSTRSSFPAVRFLLATAIIVLWIAIYYKAFTDPKFHVPEGLSGVAIAAATYLFGSGLLSKKGDDE
jgi:hypothetical protein